jgi:hypothetical protein
MPQYAPLTGQNNAFADLDMLPLGVVYHQNATGGGIYGPPSPTHLTRDEQTTLMTLAIVTRAPLIFGGRLPLDADDAWTLGLLTNEEALQVHGLSGLNRPIPAAGGAGEAYAWAAAPEAIPQPSAFIALFNAGDAADAVSVATRDAGLPAGGSWCVRDLWLKADAGSAGDTLSVTLPAHGAGLFLVQPCSSGAAAPAS